MTLRSCILMGIIILSGGALVAILGVPTPNYIANFGLPLLLVALSVTIYNLLIGVIKERRKISFLGRSIIHVSLVIILMGIFLSSSMQTNYQKSLKQGEIYSVQGIELKVGNASFSGPLGVINTSNGTLPECSILTLDIVVSSGKNSFTGKLWTGLYSVYGLASQPVIFRSIMDDIHITMGATDLVYQSLMINLATSRQPQLSEFVIQLKIIPYVSLIWIGVTLFAAGIIMSIVSNTKHGKNQDKNS